MSVFYNEYNDKLFKTIYIFNKHKKQNKKLKNTISKSKRHKIRRFMENEKKISEKERENKLNRPSYSIFSG